MPRNARIQVRGIYTTALTAVLAERGFEIVSPVGRTRERFGLPENADLEEVSITDRRDRHGVLLTGLQEQVTEVRAALAAALPHTLFAPVQERPEREEQGDRPAWVAALDAMRRSVSAEFPATMKAELDRIRSDILPTIPGHHHLKVIDPEVVDQAEIDLAGDPSIAESLSRDLFRELVYDLLVPGAPLEIDHVKAGEATIRTRGSITEHRGRSFKLTRTFKGGGQYDSLDIPIALGDWGTISFDEGGWIVRRQYFRAGGELLGELYNINTPVELYPDHARYVDLEVDVAYLPPRQIRVVDVAVLEAKVAKGLIPRALATEAIRRAGQVEEGLQARRT